jgi:cytochrome c oxidase assembly factor CtaG
MSLHMLSHVAIILIAAPLLIWGIESDLNKKSIAGRFTTFLGRYPLISWITGTMTMWLWHVPYFFHLGMETADMTNPGNHLMGLFGYIHLTSLLSGGIIFWAPVLFIQTGSGLKPLETVLYLTTACISCSVLGLLITFAPPGMYISGMSMTGMSNISALRDQQVAGLIMWVPCCFVYLTVSMLILIEWMSEKNNRRSAMIEIQKQKLA